MDFSGRASGGLGAWLRLVTILRSLPFLPQGTFLHMCNLESLLELKNEKCVVSLSLIKAGFSFSFLLRLLRVPWTARRSNQLILKEISPEYSLEELMLKLQSDAEN